MLSRMNFYRNLYDVEIFAGVSGHEWAVGCWAACPGSRAATANPPPFAYGVPPHPAFTA